MYCQLHRPVTSGSQLACALGHIGDRIFWIQKGMGLPDALGIVPPPYFPLLHVALTLVACVLLAWTLVLHPALTLFRFSACRRRNAKLLKCSGPVAFARIYLSGLGSMLWQMFLMTSILNMIFLIIFRDTHLPSNGDQNPEVYSQVMRNKLHKFGVIF